MLPAEFPTGRILRYGYRAEWFGADALKTRAGIISENLLDRLSALRVREPTRPLIFVAHSFGGLVVVKV
jgi:alpha-beta hydrolase superfamily lysophospholipase